MKAIGGRRIVMRPEIFEELGLDGVKREISAQLAQTIEGLDIRKPKPGDVLQVQIHIYTTSPSDVLRTGER